MPDRLTIFHKGLFLIAVPLLLQIAFLIYLAIEQSHNVREKELALRSKDVLEAADGLERTLMNANGALRSFALTGDPDFTDRFREAVATFDAHINTTRGLIATPAQQELFEKVAARIDSTRIAMEETMDAMPAGGTRLTLQTINMIEPARQSLLEFRGAEKALDRQYATSVRETSRRTLWVLGGGLLAALVATIASVGIFSRYISHRLAQLSGNVELFLRGQPLPPPMRGTDEISRMDHIFQAMATSITASSKKEKLYKDSLEKRAAALSEANAELRQKSEENEMFVYSVSHDLRSPLVNLQGFSRELTLVTGDLKGLLQQEEVPSHIRKRAEELLAGDMAESLQFIQQGVTRLANIIDALLRLSRAGRVEYLPQVVPLEPMARAVASTLEGTRAEKGATIEIGSLPSVWMDPSAVEQVLANCMANALNYLDPTRPGHIEVGSLPAAEGDTSVTLFIKDNGLGIPDAYLPKVFMVFQRLHGDAAPGEGIGLALVRRVLERNNGRIWVESRPGEGSTFFVELPSVNGSRDENDDKAKARLFSQNKS